MCQESELATLHQLQSLFLGKKRVKELAEALKGFPKLLFQHLPLFSTNLLSRCQVLVSELCEHATRNEIFKVWCFSCVLYVL